MYSDPDFKALLKESPTSPEWPDLGHRWTPSDINFGERMGIDLANITAEVSGYKYLGRVPQSFIYINACDFRTLEFPNLFSVGYAVDTDSSPANVDADASITLNNCPNVASLRFPWLEKVAGDLKVLNFTSLTSALLIFKRLRSVGGDFGFVGNTNAGITNLVFADPLTTTFAGNVTIAGNTHLAAIAGVPHLVFTNGKTLDFSNNALSVGTVNNILARCVALGLTTATIILSSGSNAAPAGQGATDKATLIAAGCTVTTN